MNITTANRSLGAHAIVIGGSLGGLMAAHALSERFERVTIVEKDCFPAPGETRKGVPQAHHVHGLLSGGFRIMQSLFPGLKDELVRAGALYCDMINEFRWHQFGHYKVRFESGLGGLLVSRPLLEAKIRGRIVGLPNVGVQDATKVRGLLATADQRRIIGVKLQRKEGEEEALYADLVVDASGRGSRTPRWLEELGFARPVEEEIRIGMGYTTRYYRRRPGDLDGHKGVVAALTPPFGKRMCAMVAIEGDRWHVTFGGFLGDHAPTDEAGYLAFARSLPVPEVHDIIKESEPLSDFVTYKFPTNLRRRYELLPRFPEGYLITGDAVCSFNPIYGQGMSVAAMEAQVLSDCLAAQHHSLEGLPYHFFKRAAKVIDVPWGLAAGADFAYPEVEGKCPMGVDLVNRYVARLHEVAAQDKIVCRAFFDVINLLKPPNHLFAPRVAFRVIRGSKALRRLPDHVAPIKHPTPLPQQHYP